MGAISGEQITEVIEHFQYTGTLIKCEPYGSGHINDTFLLVYDLIDRGEIKIILQKMNQKVFLQPIKLMENIMGVTSYLRERIIEYGGDPERETLNVIRTTDGKPYYIDSQGEYWRSYQFITDATSYDQVEKPEHFYQSAEAFGRFQKLLAEYPAETLHETIQGFHDTKARFAQLKDAVNQDVMGRVKEVGQEIEFAFKREDLAVFFTDLREQGKIPLRVTHNDTKLNNIMIDNKTGQGICVIDLDTVMPGLAVHDFGDSIRFGASTAAEDEQDLKKVTCDMELFELYTRGFITGCGGKLTSQEIELLPMGAKAMTYECGMRFLADYLNGDTYFKIHREKQNLDRCRTQFKLVEDMEQKWYTMQEIISRYNK